MEIQDEDGSDPISGVLHSCYRLCGERGQR
jgi:hypothetical protein